MSASSKTVDHDEIRKWAEARGGRPSIVRTGGAKGKNKSGGVLRIDFGPKEEKFEEISWEEFFAVFDESHVSFLHQDQTKGGKESRFNKFVERSPEEDQPARKKTVPKASPARKDTPARTSTKSAPAKSPAAKSSGEKSAQKKAAARSASSKSSESTGGDEAPSARKAKATAARGATSKSTSSSGSKTAGTKSSRSKVAKAEG